MLKPGHASRQASGLSLLLQIAGSHENELLLWALHMSDFEIHQYCMNSIYKHLQLVISLVIRAENHRVILEEMKWIKGNHFYNSFCQHKPRSEPGHKKKKIFHFSVSLVCCKTSNLMYRLRLDLCVQQKTKSRLDFLQHVSKRGNTSVKQRVWIKRDNWLYEMKAWSFF